MLSDTIHEYLHEIIKEITKFDYSSCFKERIIKSLALLFQIQFELDTNGEQINICDAIEYITDLFNDEYAKNKYAGFHDN